MAYTYEGKPCAADPKAGLVEGAELGPRDSEWWYRGHPCQHYIDGTNQRGENCEGRYSHTGPCGPCVTQLRADGKDPDDFDALSLIP